MQSNDGGAAVESPGRTLTIKLVRSPIGYNARQRATVKSLGLRRMHQVVTQVDTPTMRGMIEKVKHMLLVTEATPARVVRDEEEVA